MGDDGRRSDGRFQARVTDDEILAAVRAHEPAATSEVAGEVDMTRQGADRRLRQLRDAGRVNSKKIGASLVWFSADDTGPRESAHAPRDDVDVTPDPSPSDDAGSSEPTDAGGSGGVETAVAAVDTPGSGETRQTRQTALRAVYEYLRSEGTARKRDFKQHLDTEGVDVGYGSFDSFWTNYVTGKEALKQLPGVEAPGEGEHTWRFVAADE
jgi:hypothetical protein